MAPSIHTFRSHLQFTRLIRELRLLEGERKRASLGGVGCGPPHKGAVPLSAEAGDRLFNCANMNALKRRASQTGIGSKAARAVEVAFASLDTDDDGAKDDKDGEGGARGGAALVLHEFVGSLVRVAWQCFPRGFHFDVTLIIFHLINELISGCRLQASTSTTSTPPVT